jgi:UDP-N-acetylmuramoylalanine--D-glutamate ligase
VSGAFEGERAVVVGFGVAGASAARVLREEGAEVRVSEERSGLVELPEDLREAGVELRAGGHEPAHLDDATLVVVSPGVSPSAPIVAWARERGLPVWGELELGARLASAPVIAITGTNGKTTTTGMVAACLRAGGLDAVACGNIGRPFPLAAREVRDALVVECSSFQLQVQESFHPQVSVLLNLAPDHLDWHGSMESYAAAKGRIFANQRAGDTHVGNRDDALAAILSGSAACAVRWFTMSEPAVGEVGWVDDVLTARTESMQALGSVRPDTPAIRADAAACASACLAFGVHAAAIREGLASFVPERHRGETVATVAGVRFVDNSKATNPHATLAAVGTSEGVVLIAGGDAKGVDLAPLGALADRLAGVVAIGAAADEIVRLFEGRVPTRKSGSIEEAVGTAFDLSPPAGTVLLAPACASWDMFRDYGERGDRFALAARAVDGSARG